MQVDFLSATVGLSLKVKVYVNPLPGSFICKWDFGDGSEVETVEDKLTSSHLYENTDFYTVKLTLIDQSDDSKEYKVIKSIGVSEVTKTQLPGSIYDLIDTYVPSDIFGEMPISVKQQYIEKWQLYIQPLVDRDVLHRIPIEQYNNELYYEALENQLIMELAAYDFMVDRVSLMLGASAEGVIANNSSSTSSSEESTSTAGSEAVKRIQTGPSEVEFFDQVDSDSKTTSSVVKAMQPGGIIDILKQKICMLAGRLDIYLPICDRPGVVVVPKVVNRRVRTPLGGPDPGYPVKK